MSSPPTSVPVAAVALLLSARPRLRPPRRVRPRIPTRRPPMHRLMPPSPRTSSSLRPSRSAVVRSPLRPRHPSIRLMPKRRSILAPRPMKPLRQCRRRRNRLCRFRRGRTGLARHRHHKRNEERNERQDERNNDRRNRQRDRKQRNKERNAAPTEPTLSREENAAMKVPSCARRPGVRDRDDRQEEGRARRGGLHHCREGRGLPRHQGYPADSSGQLRHHPCPRLHEVQRRRLRPCLPHSLRAPAHGRRHRGLAASFAWWRQARRPRQNHDRQRSGSRADSQPSQVRRPHPSLSQRAAAHGARQGLHYRSRHRHRVADRQGSAWPDRVPAKAGKTTILKKICQVYLD